MTDIEYVKLDETFANEIATIHADSLSGDVLPALGDDFLTRYYQYVITEPEQLIIGALSHGALVGFCQLSFSPITATNILYNIPSALFTIAKLALKDVRLFVSGIQLALNRPNEILKLPEISFIAVRPDFQGRGVGKRLVETVNEIAAEKCKKNITTKTSNEIARMMYEKSFNAHVITTKAVLDKKYWYLSWKTDEQVR